MAEILLINPPGTRIIDTALSEGRNNIGPDRRYNTLAWQGTVAAWINHFFPTREMRFLNMQEGKECREHASYLYEGRNFLAYHTGKPLHELRNAAKEGRTFLLHGNTTYEASGLVEAASIIRKENPDALLIAGGMDVSARPLYFAPYVDTVVRGEIEALNINGLEYILTGKTKGIVTGHSFAALSDIPLPDLTVGDIRKFHDQSFGSTSTSPLDTIIYSIEMSRGCPRACGFCTTSSLKGKKIRTMSPKRIAEQLLHLKKKGVTHVEIYDDNFLLGRSDEEVLEIMDVFQTVGISYSWPNGSIELGRLYNPHTKEVRTDLIQHLYGPFCAMAYLPVDKVAKDQVVQYSKFRPFQGKHGFDIELHILEAISATAVPSLHFGIIIGTADETKNDRSITTERALRIKELLGISATSGREVYGHIFTSLPAPGSNHYEKYLCSERKYPPETHSPLWNCYIAQRSTPDATLGQITRERDDIFLRVNGPKIYDAWRRTGRFLAK